VIPPTDALIAAAEAAADMVNGAMEDPEK